MLCSGWLAIRTVAREYCYRPRVGSSRGENHISTAGFGRSPSGVRVGSRSNRWKPTEWGVGNEPSNGPYYNDRTGSRGTWNRIDARQSASTGSRRSDRSHPRPRTSPLIEVTTPPVRSWPTVARFRCHFERCGAEPRRVTDRRRPPSAHRASDEERSEVATPAPVRSSPMDAADSSTTDSAEYRQMRRSRPSPPDHAGGVCASALVRDRACYCSGPTGRIDRIARRGWYTRVVTAFHYKYPRMIQLLNRLAVFRSVYGRIYHTK